MGKRITDKVVKELKNKKKLQKGVRNCLTDKIPLPGGRIPNKKNWQNYEDITSDQLVNDYDINEEIARHLLRSYGTNAEHVLNYAKENELLYVRLLPEEPYIYAEVIYAIQNEYCRHIEDFFWFRTFLALENDFTACIDRVATIFQEELRWTAEKAEKEKINVIERLKVAQFKK